MGYQASPISLSDLIQACERDYANQGYVKWADLAREFGVTRQGIYGRLLRAVENGDLSQKDLDRYRTVTSRRKASAFHERSRKLQHFEITLSVENAMWLHRESKLRSLPRTDIIDGLLTQARFQSSSQPQSQDDLADPRPQLVGQA